MKKPSLGNSLAEVNPRLAAEWHPVKNRDLTPFDVTSGSSKKVWWKCTHGDDHVWKAVINKRSKRGDGCLICSGRKVVISNSLATKQPKVSKEWHSTKNGNLTAFDFTEFSNKKIWWKCPKGKDHEWIAPIHHRSEGIGCPICSGRKIVNSNSLKTINPLTAVEWHPIKNGQLTPENVGPGSHKKVWWKCPKGNDHEWEARIYTRTKGIGCPICSGRNVIKTTSLASTNPILAEMFHPTKNGVLTPYEIKEKSGKKIWWKCPKGDDHEFYQTPANLKGCPICSGHKIVKSNSIISTHPQLAKQWHPTKNDALTPDQVGFGQDRKVWWKCPKGDDHEWMVSLNSRTSSKTDCPVCSGKKVTLSNCLLTTEPNIAKQWHKLKNGNLTPFDLTRGSKKKVWWKCSKGDDHEWKAVVYSRTNGLDCPFCSLTPQSKQELIITFELKTLFKKINPKGLKTKLNGRIRAIDIFIPSLNLAIEFDGSYWHKGKRSIDKIKSEMLLEKGFEVIRIREEPLKKIHDKDIISSKPYNGKSLTNDILNRILKIYKLDDLLLTKINAYIQKDTLQNEKGLNRYIDNLLKGKYKNN